MTDPLQRDDLPTYPNAVAVIGMACRFPGADDVQALWGNLRAGVESLTRFTDEELLASGIDPSWLQNPDYVKANAILGDITAFDADFFGLSPREAEIMDPQERIMLECAWEAMEDAGYAPKVFPGRVSVFAGSRFSEYLANNQDPIDQVGLTTGSPLLATHRHWVNDKDFLATRISYQLDLKGPSMTVQTACSTSLVAIHLASRSLLSGESDLALAGGVAVRVPQKAGHLFNEGMIFSSDGHTRTFDAEADGTIFSSGAGVLVLKRLDRALADGDSIRAVVLGSAVNNDGGGEAKTRYSAPSRSGQAQVIRDAIASAQVDPATITYVEAHGTATQIGDPIEFDGLVDAFRAWTDAEYFCALGSVKSNIGHTVQAAGVAGVIKVALMFAHGELVPTLHFNRPNPRLNLDGSPFFVNTANRPWETPGMPRRAGVSSFGVGGTNAHVILEEPPPRPRPESKESFPTLFTLSARDGRALRELAGRYAAHLARRPDLPLGDVCFTAAAGRVHFDHRLAVLPGSVDELQSSLAAFAAGENPDALTQGLRRQKQAPVAFLFTGQGAQYPGMGRELYEREPVFRRTIDECSALLAPYLDVPLTDILFPPDEAAAARIHETAYTQPALFALEYALAQLWRSWGIEPAFVLGHSVGEYVAACVAGVFSLADGLRLIAERGRLIQALPQDGEMLAILAGLETAAAAAAAHPGEVSIAAVNGPENVVISGRREAVAAIHRALESSGVETRPLRTSHAFHSPLLDPMLAAFEEFAGTIAFSPPAIPLISNVTGQPADAEHPPDAAYWRRHVREAVRFSDGIQALGALGCEVFLEIGPQPTLIGMGRSALPGGQFTWVPSLKKGRSDAEQLLAGLADLYCRGIDIQWENVAPQACRRRVELPTYPFQRKRLWIEPSSRSLVYGPAGVPAAPGHPLLGQRVPSPLSTLQFSTMIDADTPPFLQDHRVFDTVTVPATAYVELAHAAAVEALHPDGQAIAVEDLAVQQACLLPAGEARRLQLILDPGADRSAAFRIYSAAPGPGEDWVLHGSGRLRIQPAAAAPAAADLAAIRARCSQRLAVDSIYQEKRARGIHHGPAFQGLKEILRGDAEALARISLPAVARAGGTFHVHPALLDACIQAGMAAYQAEETDDLYLPVVWDRIVFHAPVETRLWCHARISPDDSADRPVRTVDFAIYSEDGRLLITIEGLHFKRVDRAAFLKAGAPQQPKDLLYRIEWETVRAPRPEPSGGGPQRVLLFTDETGAGAALARELTAGGAACLQVTPGTAFKLCPETGSAQIVPGSAPDFLQLFTQAVPPEYRPFDAIVYLWGLTGWTRPDEPVQEVEAAQTPALQGLLHLAQAIPEAAAPALWIVTRGAQPAGPQPGPFSVGASSLWGLGRVFAGEHPELDCRLVDLDPAGPPEDVQQLLDELRLPGDERQLAFRGEARYAARLIRRDSRPSPDESLLRLPAERPYRLVSKQAGTFDGLELVPAARRAPGAGEIEIRIRATGLNFRDVLIALGRFEDVLGRECAGTIAAVGQGVTDFNVGDAVMAVAPASFAEYVTIPAQHAVLKPDHLGFEQAATIPMAFLTAYHGLHTLAKMRRGDRVLIHAAAGGVGQAAIQLAQAAGAEVYATASRRKWAYLRAQGIRHILDSRSLDFADDVMRLTEGRGVGIVLNSLAGEFIPTSLGVLAENGRFIEIGATDVWSPEQAAAVRPDVDYHWFHLGKSVAARDPERFQAMFRTIRAAFQAGALRPLPHVAYDITETPQAFRLMSQARQIGKVVVRHPVEVQDHARPLNAGRTYLLTGAFGGLGLKVIEWMAGQGARHLVLVGRSAPQGEARALLENLESAGIRAAVVQADVADWDVLAAKLEPVLAEMPPLGGVIHLAGVLDDGILQQQSWERFERVLRPKVSGAWNLHRLVGDLPLDFFVLFSSVASLWGNAGQGNYAAANAFLDALAHYRRAQGLAAVSINWGAWAEVGMAADLGDAVERRRSESGLGKIDPAEGVALLAEILNGGEAQVGVIPVDWSRYRPPSENGFGTFFSRLMPEAAAAAAPQPPAPRTDLVGRLQGAHPGQRLELMTGYLLAQTAKIVGIPLDRLEAGQSLADLGVDSLMAVELRNRISQDLDLQVPMRRFLRNPDLASLAADLLAERGLVESAPEQAPLAQVAEPDPLLVRLQSEGAGRPFFCVHGFGGGVLGYGDLARLLGTEQPFYGIQAAGVDGNGPPDETIEDMAARYIRAVRSVQPEGPYDLGGYCLGGLVAYEMARRLKAEGEEVGLVAIVEGYVPDVLKARANAGLRKRIAAVWRNVPYWVQDYWDLGFDKLRRRVMRRLKGRGGRRVDGDAVPQDVVDDDLGLLPEDQLRVMVTQIRANREYAVEPYPGEVVVFRASGQTISKALFGSLDETLGWGRFAERVEVVEVEGGHRNVHLKPYVASLAAQLKDALRRRRGARPAGN